MRQRSPLTKGRTYTMFKKIAHWYLKIVETICVFLLFLILVCMCIQITCRLFTVGQNFTEELSRLSFSLLIFLGAPLALAEGADIGVDMAVNLLPAAARRLIDFAVNLLIALFSLVCIRSLVTFTGSNLKVTAVSMTWIRMNWLYYTFMFSFGCMFLIALVKAFASLTGRDQTLDIHKAEKEQAKLEEKEVDLGI